MKEYKDKSTTATGCHVESFQIRNKRRMYIETEPMKQFTVKQAKKLAEVILKHIDAIENYEFENLLKEERGK